MDEPILTILEARVPKERWAELQERYRKLGEAESPPERLSGMLAQSVDDPELWVGVSVWRSAAALQAYRARVEVPAGLKLLRDVAGEVTLRRFAVRVRD